MKERIVVIETFEGVAQLLPVIGKHKPIQCYSPFWGRRVRAFHPPSQRGFLATRHSEVTYPCVLYRFIHAAFLFSPQ